jgi:hypothetical protein
MMIQSIGQTKIPLIHSEKAIFKYKKVVDEIMNNINNSFQNVLIEVAYHAIYFVS